MAAALSYLRQRGRSWVSIVRLLPLAGWVTVGCSVLANLVIGLLPVVFIVETSVMLERIVAPRGGPHAAAAWPQVLAAFVLAVGALVVQNALSPAQAALGELITRRIDGHSIRRLMSAGLGDAPMAVLERQDVLDKLNMARSLLTERWQTPGSAAAGLIALIARYTQVISALVLVGLVLGPLAGAVLGVVAAVVRLGSRGSLSLWSAVFARSRGPHRAMMYVLDTGSDPAAAKEVRSFGLLAWLRGRGETEARAYHGPMWRRRRQIYFAPFLGYSAAVLAGSVLLLLWLRAGVADGRVSVLGLSLAIQSILVPLRMGTFWPESDLQTMYGMLAYDTITELETVFRGGTQPGGRAGGAARAPLAAATPAAGGPTAGLPRSAIRFEGVHFRYPGSDREILRGLDLELRAGTSTAIVGVNGAGKTTLVKLLARLYEPTGGRITVDGADLRDLDPGDWQRRLAVIFQDYVRYELDAAANIGMGAPGLLREEASVRAAASWAGAEEVISSLSAGLATPLSSRYAGGTDLSGGQWQRIALARALFALGAGASVLVLDEPTAQLDVRAEVAFFDRFLDITGGLTSIVISHRFSSVRRADRIVVLEEGRVREAGSHDALMARGGRYAELFRLQARRFAAEPGEPGEAAGDAGPGAPAKAGELP
jgi:ATP-binding cassette, subfamily B, bacterial